MSPTLRSAVASGSVRGLESLLGGLEQAGRRRPSAREARRALDALVRARFTDVRSLIRFHEAVLFLRAYPQTRSVYARAEKALASIPRRVALLARAGEDLSPLDTPEVSGIAGTTITTDYSYDVVRFLVERHPRCVEIDWEGFEGTDRLRALWPDFLPLLEEEALEDANVPYCEWLRAGQSRQGEDLPWLLQQLARRSLPEKERAERYDALGLEVSWRLSDFPATRTGMRWPSRGVFLHDAPLVSRRDVSFEAEFQSPPFPVQRLSAGRGRAVIAMTRTATALRYREYYGFTYADPATVRRASVGRGVEMFLFGLERERRLPLRAGFATLLVKNGIPIGYVEALAFFERVEIGFNIYYTFRDGESAWIFAKVLKLLRQVLGVRSFSIDPYQIGHGNDEAIASGAFWFYRKLGFRSTDAALRGLTNAEERKLATDRGHRTPTRILKRLAMRNLLYELPGRGYGEWDDFHIRNLGLAVERRMAREFAGDARKIRRASLSLSARVLGARLQEWPEARRKSFEDFSLVLDLIPDLSRWEPDEKAALLGIIRAKSGSSEERYLRLMQRHARLRAAMLRLGSRQ